MLRQVITTQPNIENKHEGFNKLLHRACGYKHNFCILNFTTEWWNKSFKYCVKKAHSLSQNTALLVLFIQTIYCETASIILKIIIYFCCNLHNFFHPWTFRMRYVTKKCQTQIFLLKIITSNTRETLLQINHFQWLWYIWSMKKKSYWFIMCLQFIKT